MTRTTPPTRGQRAVPRTAAVIAALLTTSAIGAAGSPGARARQGAHGDPAPVRPRVVEGVPAPVPGADGGTPPTAAPPVVPVVERTSPGGGTVVDRPASVSGIPAPVLAAYRRAALALAGSQPGCGVPVPLLAAIGKVESGHARGGRVDAGGTTVQAILGPRLDGAPGVAAIGDTDLGRLDGDARWDRAVGPMQFIPGTWARWSTDGNGDGVASPHNVHDAATAAARYLCAGGRDLRTEAGLDSAVLSYNHSTAYLRLVRSWMAAYAGGVTAVAPTAPGGTPATEGGGGAVALPAAPQAVPAPPHQPGTTPPTTPPTTGPTPPPPGTPAPTPPGTSQPGTPRPQPPAPVPPPPPPVPPVPELPQVVGGVVQGAVGTVGQVLVDPVTGLTCVLVPVTGLLGGLLGLPSPTPTCTPAP
ncbi:lytic transglycosylase domain-containing protein [Actinokineospora spheciospongiae]|uniref:lytic transglycosylase domain-containing protein n=1 Tax=Actinokineospora spheciospongiae TaxID=909613 RepID=UPI001267BF85|nr:lytic transglycosylase domain-containing protein [Actinokineospora spheciospongiae]